MSGVCCVKTRLTFAAVRRPATPRFTVGFSVSVASLLLLASFGLGPAVFGRWLVTNDIWPNVLGARYVVAGAGPYIYESGMSGALPLFPLVVAPLVAVGDALSLSIGHPYPVPFPTMWLLLAPMLALILVAYALVLRGVLGSLGGWRRSRLAVSAGVMGAIPLLLFGHPEDLIALSAVLAACRYLLNGRYDASALCLGAAIASKQWAVLVGPAFLGAVACGQRLRYAASAAALPAFLLTVVFAADWANASRQLIASPVQPDFGRAAPWTESSLTLVTALPRASLLLLALALPWAMSRSGRAGSALTVAGAVVACRAFAEPVLHPYYVTPGLIMMWLALPARLAVQVGAAAAAVSLWFAAPVTGIPWWLVLYGLVAGLIVVAVAASVRAATSSR